MGAATTRWFAPVLVGILTLGPVAAGCSDESTTDGTAATTTEATTDTAAPTPEATTEPPATEPPATEPPTTEPPTTEPPATEPPATEPPATEPPTTEAPAATTLVNVYWGWTVANMPVGSPERIGAGARFVPGDTPTRNSLEAMFAGTNEVEAEIGMVSSIPAGTRVLGIAVDGTTATVDLSGEFEAPSGSLDESMRLAQVVFAVTQFPGFDRVRFAIDGELRDSILSHGFEVSAGLTRDDFPDVRAFIMIEEPYPGADVGNPLVIRGESNTFEATIQYAITTGGGDGLIVTEGFTTATSGNGTWGQFEIVLDLTEYPDTYQPGPGSIIMWESSPEDGSQLFLVEIPVDLPEL